MILNYMFANDYSRTRYKNTCFQMIYHIWPDPTPRFVPSGGNSQKTGMGYGSDEYEGVALNLKVSMHKGRTLPAAVIGVPESSARFFWAYPVAARRTPLLQFFDGLRALLRRGEHQQGSPRPRANPVEKAEMATFLQVNILEDVGEHLTEAEKRELKILVTNFQAPAAQQTPQISAMHRDQLWKFLETADPGFFLDELKEIIKTHPDSDIRFANLAGFLEYGGYVYVDKRYVIQHMNTVVPGFEGLFFSRARIVESKTIAEQWAAALTELDKWADVTLPPLKAKGAVKFAWLAPCETEFLRNQAGLQALPHVPDGGFIYLFADDTIRYFKVIAGKKAFAEELKGFFTLAIIL